jgi:hypothetical protein
LTPVAAGRAEEAIERLARQPHHFAALTVAPDPPLAIPPARNVVRTMPRPSASQGAL